MSPGKNVLWCRWRLLPDEFSSSYLLQISRWFKDVSSRPSWLAVKDDIKSTN